MILGIDVCKVGHPALSTNCTPVEKFDRSLRSLVQRMFETMKEASGAGLAANQIGITKRVFVYECPDEEGIVHRGVFVNPEIENRVGVQVEPEGCLSIPSVYREVSRAAEVLVSGFDLEGNPRELKATGYLARCMEHEVDHLNGELYVDQLDADERAAALREYSERSLEEKKTGLL